MSSVEDAQALQAIEYGTYVASYPILVNGVRAYNPGDAVPVSNVEQHGYLDQGLVRLASEAAPAAPEPPAPPALPAGQPITTDSPVSDAPVADTTPKES